MNKLCSFTIVASIMVLGNSTLANEGCTEAWVCEMAGKITKLISDDLPMQQSRNMSITAVTSEYETLIMRAVLAYEREFLEDFYKEAGKPLSVAVKGLQDSVNRICKDKAGFLYKFINLGGVVKYSYFFIDGEQFTEVTVSSCG